MKTLLFILLISINSCAQKEVKQNQGEEDYPQKIELNNDELCEISTITSSSITPIFFKLIGTNKISEVESIQKNTLYLSNEKCIAKNLYFKNNQPIEAGKYKNESPYQVYDFIYLNQDVVKVAFENIKLELKKLSIENNYEYFDYFKSVNYVYFFNLKENKITIVRFSGVNGIYDYNHIIDFSNKNKDYFTEIIFVDVTGYEVIK